MRNLLSLKDWTFADVLRVMDLAESFESGNTESVRGAAVLFFPESSIRTRVTFEMACARLGLQPILFPPDALSKREDPRDVVGYLGNWANVMIARYPDIERLREFADGSSLPVINAMTDVNHPCEMLSDLYALKRRREDWQSLRYLFVGADGNIGRAWAEAAQVCGLSLHQAGPESLRIPGVPLVDFQEGLHTADVILTDGVGPHREALVPYRVSGKVLDELGENVLFNPCPPFDRAAEVDADAIDNPRFVGYGFKASLLPVHQAVIRHCLEL